MFRMERTLACLEDVIMRLINTRFIPLLIIAHRGIWRRVCCRFKEQYINNNQIITHALSIYITPKICSL